MLVLVGNVSILRRRVVGTLTRSVSLLQSSSEVGLSEVSVSEGESSSLFSEVIAALRRLVFLRVLLLCTLLLGFELETLFEAWVCRLLLFDVEAVVFLLVAILLVVVFVFLVVVEASVSSSLCSSLTDLIDLITLLLLLVVEEEVFRLVGVLEDLKVATILMFRFLFFPLYFFLVKISNDFNL